MITLLLAALIGVATPQPVTVTASDGVPLACSIVEPDGTAPSGGWPAVILFHGLGGSHTDMEPLATQALLAREAWQIGALFFLAMALAMLPAGFWAGGADLMPGRGATRTTMREVVGQAMRNRPGARSISRTSSCSSMAPTREGTEAHDSDLPPLSRLVITARSGL